MHEYGFNIVTNDYQFLFRFALETDALIEVNDFDQNCDSFTLRYAEIIELERAKNLLDSILQGR